MEVEGMGLVQFKWWKPTEKGLVISKQHKTGAIVATWKYKTESFFLKYLLECRTRLEPKPRARTLSLGPTSLLASKPCLPLSTHKIQKDGSNGLFGLRGERWGARGSGVELAKN